MATSYDTSLVILSVIVAMLASFTGFNFAARSHIELGARRRMWLVGAAISMGLGMWSAHAIGLLAFERPTSVEYDAPMMLLSTMTAIIGSFVSFALVNGRRQRSTTIVLAALVMGMALLGMVYAGVASIRLVGSPSYEAFAVVMSAITALIGSIAAIWLTTRLPDDVTVEGALSKLGGAITMGVAIAATHYISVGGTRFTANIGIRAADSHLVSHSHLDEVVVAGGLVIIILAVIGAMLQRNVYAARNLIDRLREQALLTQQSELRTRVILDNALDAVISMDASGLIIDWNAQAERIFGWSRAEALGRRMSETIVPERFRARHESGLKQFLLTGKESFLNKRIEISALDRSGREFPVELAISPAKVTEEWAFSAFIRDLTERKQAESALKEGEKRYRELFENSPIGLYTSTPDGGLLDVNSAMVAMLGYPDRNSLLAVRAQSLYVDPAEREEWLAQQTSEIDVLDVDVRLLRRDGTMIWARDTTHMKRGADGFVVLYEGALEEITDRVKAEAALQANERRLTQILEAVPVGIIVSDNEGHIMFANATAQQILGKGVVPDAPVTDQARVYQTYVAGTDELYPVERNPIARALGGEAISVEDVEVRQGGRVISLSVQGAPILNTEGKIVAAVLVFSDVTEKRSLEGQLRQASKMEAVGQLAGGVAHDFNNLLTVIMSYGSMLLERLAPEDESREDVREIAAAADRAAALTRQLLAFSRQQVLQPRVMNVNHVIGDVEKMLRRIIGEDVELHTSLAPDLAMIHADPGQLEQILMNLVVNARDAMAGGGRVCITTSNAQLPAETAGVAPFNSGGPYVILSVSDTGTGMSPEVRQRIFDPFFTTKAPGYGTGLGLSTVYGIVKQSGGDIYVDSQLGAGSTITLYFPRFAGAAETPTDVAAASESSRGSEAILIVEDDDNLRHLVARVLTARGYTVHVANTGATGLAIASNQSLTIDAVITDVVMPGMNGRELVEELLEGRPALGCLFMSGYTDDEILRRGVSRGEAAFLQKPFTPEQLSQSLRLVLDRPVLGSAA